MSADHETTTPEAAAQYEADRTPYYDERWDRYEDEAASTCRECELDPETLATLRESAFRADRLLRGITGRRS